MPDENVWFIVMNVMATVCHVDQRTTFGRRMNKLFPMLNVGRILLMEEFFVIEIFASFIRGHAKFSADEKVDRYIRNWQTADFTEIVLSEFP